MPPYPTSAKRGGTAYSTSEIFADCCLAAGMAVEAARLKAGTTAWERDREIEFICCCAGCLLFVDLGEKQDFLYSAKA